MASPRMDRLEGEASSAKQEVAGVGARCPRPSGEEEDDRGVAVAGWAGWAGWWAPGGLQVS